MLAKIDDPQKQAGTEKSKMLTAQAWLRTMEDLAGCNAVWDARVIRGQTDEELACMMIHQPKFILDRACGGNRRSAARSAWTHKSFSRVEVVDDQRPTVLRQRLAPIFCTTQK
ncbi:hypothetical protein [Bradyrhizobium liaoningense]